MQLTALNKHLHNRMKTTLTYPKNTELTLGLRINARNLYLVPRRLSTAKSERPRRTRINRTVTLPVGRAHASRLETRVADFVYLCLLSVTHAPGLGHSNYFRDDTRTDQGPEGQPGFARTPKNRVSRATRKPQRNGPHYGAQLSIQRKVKVDLCAARRQGV